MTMEIMELFNQRLDLFGGKKEEIVNKTNALQGTAKEFIQFLYGTMPLSDVANYDFEVFLDYVNHAVQLYKHTKLDKEMFLQYVLYHRVNNECITPCRAFFHDKVVEEIGSVSYDEAYVLAVNYFCASHVTYKASDERTASPKAIFHKGHGRCGEQSTFVSSVFRSLGIAARQVYVKRWSHCDDNHAWTEIYVDGRWQFLGACEPEEVLNKGWFLNASSRAMLVHHKTFFPVKDKTDFISRVGGTYLYNELSRYAQTKRITVTIKDMAGNLIDTPIGFGVYNYGEICNIATLTTNNGMCSFETGLGSLQLSAYYEDCFYETIIDVNEQDCFDFVLQAPTKATTQFVFTAPPTFEKNKGAITAQQKIIGSEKSKQAIMKRGNRTRVTNDIFDLEITKTLAEKDLSDVDRADLLDHSTVENTGNIPNQIFLEYVVCPRVYMEEITSYKSFIANHFDESTKAEFRKNPAKVYAYIKDTISFMDGEEYDELYTTPKGLLTVKSGSVLSQKILFVAILRSLGVPAKLEATDFSLSYYENGSFVTLDETAKGTLTLQFADQTKWEYMQNITIGRFENNQFVTLALSNDALCAPLSLPLNTYRIITCNRLPKGDMLVRTTSFDLGGDTQVPVALTQAKIDDMLSINRIGDFDLVSEGGDAISASELFVKKGMIGIWLEPAKEPTEHILNELFEKQEELISSGVDIYFILPNKEAKSDRNISRLLETLPTITCVYDTVGTQAEAVARAMYTNPELLPLIVLFSDHMTGAFACSGYNVGTVEMLLKLIDVMQ